MKGGSPLREREGESHQIWAERRREGGRRICTGEWEEGRMGEWEAAAWAWEREREQGRTSEGGCRSAECLRKSSNPKLKYIYEELLGLAWSYWASAFLGGGHYSVPASKNGFMAPLKIVYFWRRAL
jgi:hypothetical protein